MIVVIFVVFDGGGGGGGGGSLGISGSFCLSPGSLLLLVTWCQRLPQSLPPTFPRSHPWPVSRTRSRQGQGREGPTSPKLRAS